MKKLLIALLFVAFATISTTTFGQAGLGTLAGTVTDSSGAVISNASVTLTGSNAIKQTVSTNSAGQYRFTNLIVGPGYTLEVSAPNFTAAKISNLSTSVGTTVTQNVTLQAGGATTTIEVQGGNVEQVQTETSSVSQAVDRAVWENAPLSVRTQNEFVGLVAGAAGDAGTGRGYAINGARSGTGNFLVDGYDNNDQGMGGAGTTMGGGGAVTTISPDAIQEFRVITSTPPAEYGRAGGFSTDTVLRSGTNTFHGSAFEYNRIQALAANNFFSNRQGIRDHLVRNQFGGAFGGPIKKERTYFWATVEFLRTSTASPTAGVVTTTQQFLNFVSSGQFQSFMEGTSQNLPGTVNVPGYTSATQVYQQQGVCVINTGATCPGVLARSATLGSTFSTLYSRFPGQFPLATQTDASSNIAQGLFTSGDCYNPQCTILTSTYFPVPVYGTTVVQSTNKTRDSRGTMKLDHKLTSRDQLSFTYLADIEDSLSNNGFGDTTPGPPGIQFGGSQNFGATWIHTFSPSLINTFKASYLRHVSNFDTASVYQSIPSFWAADSLSVGFGVSSAMPQYFTDNQFAYEDSLNYVRGRHNMKFGFRYVRTRNGSSFVNDQRTEVAPWSVEGLVTDGKSDQDVDSYFFGGTEYGGLYAATGSIDTTTKQYSDPYRGYRANEFSTYLQDDWKVSPRLMVNYGLRWEYFGPPHNFRAGYDSNVYFGAFGTPTATGNPFLPNVPLLAATQGAKFIQKNNNIWNKDMNNFAPRVGFSLDTFGNGKLVLRGGFGIGFDRLYNNAYENIRFNYPRFVDNQAGILLSGVGVSESLRAATFVPSTSVGQNVAISTANSKPVPRHIDERLVTAYYEQAHFGVQTQLASGYVLEANYVGTFGRKLIGLMNINTFPGRLACYSGSTNAQLTRCANAGYSTFSTARPTSLFGSDNFRTNAFGSNYNGGQLSLRKGFSHGLQMLVNYTYSKTMDETSDIFTIKSGGTGITKPYDPHYDYAPSDFDVRHNVSIQFAYQSISRSHPLLLGGWGFSPIAKLQSGSPIYLKYSNSSYDPNKDGVTGVERPIYLGTGSITSAINHKISPADGYLKPNTFGPYSCPTTVNAGLFCDVPTRRNALYGPAFMNLDAAISKRFQIKERYSFKVEAAFFDVLNNAEFGTPVGDAYSANFGKSISATNREGQLSARFEF